MLGLKVMINALAGVGQGDVKEDFSEKKIKEIIKSESDIIFVFEDDSQLRIFDDGQSCCEHRYLTCDDELQHFYGHTIKSIETREIDNGPTSEYGDEHEKNCIHVIVDDGRHMTLVNHNEHNGYYGGFWLRYVYPNT